MSVPRSIIFSTYDLDVTLADEGIRATGFKSLAIDEV